MPLLAEERRASVIRQRVGAVVMLLGLVGGGYWLFFSGDGEPEPTESAPQEPIATAFGTDIEPPPTAMPAPGQEPAAEPEPAEVEEERPSTAEESSQRPVTAGAISRHDARFGEARFFREAVRNAGLTAEEAASLERALDGVLEFRRCRPRDRMSLERDTDGNLVRFEYRKSATEYYVMTRAADGSMSGEKVEREIERVRVARGGHVTSSLGDAFTRAGLGRSVVGTFVEAFGTKARFASQARRGDRFRVVVEEELVDGEHLRWGTVHALDYVGENTGELSAYRYEHRGRPDYYDSTGRSLNGSWLRVPLHYERMSSPFDPHRMHPILRRVHPHNGIDYAAATGTPVWAAASGTITHAGPKGPNGNLVSIRHENGYSSHYAHLHRIQSGIRPGVEVEQRQLIGAVGTTGRSTGPHLHFGVKRNSSWIDPAPVLDGPGRMLPAGPLGRFRNLRRRLDRELAAIEVTPLPGSNAEEDDENEDTETEPSDEAGD